MGMLALRSYGCVERSGASMKRLFTAGAIALGVFVSACAYQAPVVSTPNLNVYTS
jgi:hypothetical protein